MMYFIAVVWKQHLSRIECVSKALKSMILISIANLTLSYVADTYVHYLIVIITLSMHARYLVVVLTVPMHRYLVVFLTFSMHACYLVVVLTVSMHRYLVVFVTFSIHARCLVVVLTLSILCTLPGHCPNVVDACTLPSRGLWCERIQFLVPRIKY